jgi:hypothetical protein
MPSRRDALRTLAAGALAPTLHGQHQHPETLAQIATPQTPKIITGDDFRLLCRFVDMIIPPTDTPGAADAGVGFYIDGLAGQRPQLRQEIQQGLAALRTVGFPQADAEKQTAILKGMESSGDIFFKTLKDLTIDGYYSSRDGLVKELGYHGRTYLREFPGCTHPEHIGDNSAA